METKIIVTLLFISLAVTGLSLLWRTCIYTRGGIFRPIGRILDHWVELGCGKEASFGHKLLRFIAYPLGRCIFCNSFHLTYDVFLIANYKLELGLDPWNLIFLFPIVQVMVIISVKLLILGNESQKKEDWKYMEQDTSKLWDFGFKKRELESPLTEKEERELESCKSGIITSM